jgi:hypothetical protein
MNEGAKTAMVQQLETAPAEMSEPAPLPATTADVPASPASLWASESRANYSITHTDQSEHDWIDCGCVIHSE